MKIAVYAFDGATMFHLSTPQIVFDEVARQGLADWTTVLFADRAGSVLTSEGYRLSGVQGAGAAADADVVVVPTWENDGRSVSAVLERTLHAAHDRGAMIVGLCLGAIALADVGLLAGRSAVTHWRAADDFATRHPDVLVDASALYLDLGDVMTSAGTASGLDACLHLVRARLGADAANRVARMLVIAPHREGGQAQYIQRPVARRVASDPVATAIEFSLAHLQDDLSVDALAATARMSRRSFARAFRAYTGATPAAWVRTKRLDEARRLLEASDYSVDQISSLCGFGNPVTLRQNFLAAFACTPSSYRRRFGARHVSVPPRSATVLPKINLVATTRSTSDRRRPSS